MLHSFYSPKINATSSGVLPSNKYCKAFNPFSSKEIYNASVPFLNGTTRTGTLHVN